MSINEKNRNLNLKNQNDTINVQKLKEHEFKSEHDFNIFKLHRNSHLEMDDLSIEQQLKIVPNTIECALLTCLVSRVAPNTKDSFNLIRSCNDLQSKQRMQHCVSLFNYYYYFDQNKKNICFPLYQHVSHLKIALFMQLSILNTNLFLNMSCFLSKKTNLPSKKHLFSC